MRPQRAPRVRRRRGSELRHRAELYRRFPQIPEGELSRVRASLVNGDTLAASPALDLGALISLGEGEHRSGGAARPSILADALEAVFGAVFLDGGFDAACARSVGLYAASSLESILPARKDPKTRLQEWLQARKLAVPVYEVAAIRGEAHLQTVRRRVQDSGARCRSDRVGAEPARSRAGRSRRGFASSGNACLTSSAPPSAAAISPSSAAPTSASRRWSTRWSGRACQHHVEEAADDAPSRPRHPHYRRRAVPLRRHAGFPDRASLAPERSDEPDGDDSLAGVDAVVVVLEAVELTDARPRGDRAAAAPRAGRRRTQQDRRARRQGAPAAATWRRSEKRIAFAAMVPVSAEKGTQLDRLATEIARHLPIGEPLFAPEEITDRDERFLAAEFVREKIFRLLGRRNSLCDDGGDRYLRARGRTAPDSCHRLRRRDEPARHPAGRRRVAR